MSFSEMIEVLENIQSFLDFAVSLTLYFFSAVLMANRSGQYSIAYHNTILLYQCVLVACVQRCGVIGQVAGLIAMWLALFDRLLASLDMSDHIRQVAGLCRQEWPH